MSCGHNKGKGRAKGMDNIAVILIIILAAVYVARHFYKKIAPKDGGTCGCGCSSCSSAGTPSGPEKPLPQSKA